MALFTALALMPAPGQPFDAAPFGLPLPDGVGIMWEDPREIHRVVVRFKGEPPASRVRLEYWGSRWPGQHLPKDAQPGGGNVGWWELGNWHNGGWRKADARSTADGTTLTFTFNPVNAKEFPDLNDYPADFRYTLKLRLTSREPLPAVARVEAYTHSVWAARVVRVAWKSAAPPIQCDAFNGAVLGVEPDGPRAQRVRVMAARNADANSFDRTLLTVRQDSGVFTVAVDDLVEGPLYLPERGVAVLPGRDRRGYATVAAAQQTLAGLSLYDRVSAMPEQTWRGAWEGMPAKREPIYLPLGLEGGRQRFRWDGDGSVRFRGTEHFINAHPAADTERLKGAPAPVIVRFGLPARPATRTIEDGCPPIGIAEWGQNGIRTQQVAFATPLDGAHAGAPVPAGDATAVCMMRVVCANCGPSPAHASLPMTAEIAGTSAALHVEPGGWLFADGMLLGHVTADAPAHVDVQGRVRWAKQLAPGAAMTVVLRLPYVPLATGTERDHLARLDFERERAELAGYWRRRLDAGMRLIVPEPMLSDFHRAHTGHLLINCEREPGTDVRFARVGSFGYGAYGNESCMMVVDLDRRGYHAEARNCLEAWLKYQGTVGLPGDFASRKGVLYGAGGYESGGYNQHHGWILWCMAEHYRFTRDAEWLRHAAPGIVAAADWIARERKRTAQRDDLARGLLPAGSLEDIGDWWPWLSTNCYTWCGIDEAAWALAQINHPDAERIRCEAGDYRAALLAAFRAASERSPVVRLRDGTAVPKIPSQVYRRGRYFGWICETLEGAIHLLITRALDPHSPEAGAILRDYEDNLYLSNQYGYTVPNFERWWFDRGGFSMQACLLLDVEPYLYRDDVKQALRAMFNAIAADYFPDVRMGTEHALPELGDWRGDHYKSSDEANACGWLRHCFVREEGDDLLIGQAVPFDWLADGKRCGVERAATWFGPVSAVYEGGRRSITLRLSGPRRNPPKHILVRFRSKAGGPPRSVTVNGKPWRDFQGDWLRLSGAIGDAVVVAKR